MPRTNEEKVSESRSLLDWAVSDGRQVLPSSLDWGKLPPAFHARVTAGLARRIFNADHQVLRPAADRAAVAIGQISTAVCLRAQKLPDGPLEPGDFTVDDELRVKIFEGPDIASATPTHPGAEPTDTQVLIIPEDRWGT